jgi:hypothetical protein
LAADGFADDAVEALDLVRGVHGPPKRRRKREVGDDALPGVAPGLADLRVAAVPDAGEGLEAGLGGFLAFGETTTSIVNASPIPRRDPPAA